MRSKKLNTRKTVLSVITVLLGIISFSSIGYATDFPLIRTAKSSSEMLKQYQPYLDFVVQVGKQSDLVNAQKLMVSFQKLQAHNPEAAARFLKGLRFEMMEKAQRMGRTESKLTSNNPEIRSWVGRFIEEWAREADEHLYRVYSSQIAKK